MNPAPGRLGIPTRWASGWSSPSGCGWVQCQGAAKREIRAGDVVVCPPAEKHWHGATATTGMSHIAIQEALDRKVVEWLEKVSDEEYSAAPTAE